jgi:hypothetical protein
MRSLEGFVRETWDGCPRGAVSLSFSREASADIRGIDIGWCALERFLFQTVFYELMVVGYEAMDCLCRRNSPHYRT